MELLHAPGEIIVRRYHILDILGEGGSGTTYLAEDLQNGQRVALKALSLRHMSDWKAIALFEREAHVLAQLNHPAIPSYLEYFYVDTPQDRCFYIAQQLATGQSLFTLVQNGWHSSEEEVRHIGIQVLEILDYLHGLTPPVIHRDIKPQNIIRRDDGQVFLVDFGAVADTYHSTFARSNTVVGTFGYMAPEQFLGKAVPATDLYGLGATLLFLLTHCSPADLPTDRLKLNFRYRVQISSEFADWLEKMLEPDVEDRFPAAKEAIAALRLKRLIKAKSGSSVKRKSLVKLGIATVTAVTLFNHFKYPILSTFGLTPKALSQAVEKGDIKTVKHYLDLGVNANARIGNWMDSYDGDYRNLLHLAGSKEVAELLIAKGALVNARSESGFTPLHDAAIYGRKEVAQTLIAKGAEVNAKVKPLFSQWQYMGVISSLPSLVTILDLTPLHLARSPQVAELLIANGAQLNIKDCMGRSPLHTAKSKEVAELLIAKGAQLNPKDRDRVKIRDWGGSTQLHTAARIGSKKMASLLIAKGANVVARDNRSRTPLHLASSVEVASLLIVDVNARDNQGRTPLHYMRSHEMAALLIAKGADVNARDNEDNTPLHKAVLPDDSQKSTKDVVELLIAKGALVNAKNNKGDTPLHNVAQYYTYDSEVVKLLITKGADVNAKNNSGITPLHAARHNKDMVELLKHHRATKDILQK